MKFEILNLKLDQILFFLTIIFLPTQLGKHFWPDFSYIFSLRVDYLAPTLYFWDILVFLLIFVWVLNKPRVNQLALSLLMFFLLSQTASLFFAANLGAGLVRLEQYLVASLFGLYIASKDLSELKTLLFWGLLTAVLFEGILSMLQFFKGGSIGFWILGERDFSIAVPLIAKFNWFNQIFLRPYGTFSHPNVLSAFIILSLPLLWLYKPTLKKIYMNQLYTAGLMFGALAAILTFSRISIILLLLEVGILLRRNLRVVGFLLILVFPFLFIRFNSAFNFDSLSYQRREELILVGFHQISHSPLFGVGLNNSIVNASTTDLISGTSRFLQPIHNIFLLTVAETGVLGLIGLCGLFFIPLFKLFKLRNSNYSKVLLFCWGSIVLMGAFDHFFLTISQGVRMFFLIWGLSMISGVHTKFKLN